MKHHAAIHIRIGRRIRSPFTHKAVVKFEMKMRKGNFIKEMAKLVVEIAILIIPHFNHTIFNPKGIAEIDAGIMMMDFNYPVIDVFSIE